MASAEDLRWMDAALVLARRGLGRVWPNPAVGCVIVAGTRVVGRGFTQTGGRPHAEVVALRQAGEAARGATAYISLEPCAHHGKTPPCTDALIAAGVARVVAPMRDPDPRVSGRGFAALEVAGIAVETGCRVAEAMALNRGFLKRHRTGRPMVTLKLATSLDGRIATASGESRWITGPEARRLAHLMRAEHDAILVGAGTARTDDPMLDVRDLGMAERSPIRVVADGGLSLPLTGRLARTARDVPLWLLHRAGVDAGRRKVWRDLGAELIELPADETGALRMEAALETLARRGLTRVFCEGGGRLAAALMRAGLVDELVQALAGKALGGDGVPAIGALGLDRLADAPEFTLTEVYPAGADVIVRWARRDGDPGET